MQSNAGSESSAASASSDEPTATISTSPSPPTSSTIASRCASSSSTTSSRRTSRSMNDSIPPKTPSSASSEAGFWTNGGRAGHQRRLHLLDARDDVHGDVARRRMALQPVEHRPAVEHRQAHVEHDRVRPELAREREAGVAAERDEPLEAALARDLELGAGEVGVVLDDQDDAVALLDRLAVVVDLARDEQRSGRSVDVRLVAVRRLGGRRRAGVSPAETASRSSAPRRRPARARRSAPAGRA